MVFPSFYLFKAAFYIKNTNLKKAQNSGSTHLSWTWMKTFASKMCHAVPLTF